MENNSKIPFVKYNGENHTMVLRELQSLGYDCKRIIYPPINDKAFLVLDLDGKSKVVGYSALPQNVGRYKVDTVWELLTWVREHEAENLPCILKTGYLIETKNREGKVNRCLILPHEKYGLVASGPDEWFPLKDYNPKYHNIIAVWGLSDTISRAYKLEILERPLIWEAPEVFEVTLSQIADKFNIPVESLRIKDK